MEILSESDWLFPFNFFINPLAMVYFEAESNSFRAATKSMRRAGPESAQAPIQCYTSGTPSNVFFFHVSHIWDTCHKWVKNKTFALFTHKSGTAWQVYFSHIHDISLCTTPLWV